MSSNTAFSHHHAYDGLTIRTIPFVEEYIRIEIEKFLTFITKRAYDSLEVVSAQEALKNLVEFAFKIRDSFTKMDDILGTLDAKKYREQVVGGSPDGALIEQFQVAWADIHKDFFDFFVKSKDGAADGIAIAEKFHKTKKWLIDNKNAPIDARKNEIQSLIRDLDDWQMDVESMLTLFTSFPERVKLLYRRLLRDLRDVKDNFNAKNAPKADQDALEALDKKVKEQKSEIDSLIDRLKAVKSVVEGMSTDSEDILKKLNKAVEATSASILDQGVESLLVSYENLEIILVEYINKVTKFKDMVAKGEKWVPETTTVPGQPTTTPKPAGKPAGPVPDGYYVLRSAQEKDRVIDLSNAEIKQDNKIWSYRTNSTNAQKWKLVWQPEKQAYFIASSVDSKGETWMGYSADKPEGSLSAQKAASPWTLVPVPGAADTYFIKTPNNFVVDLWQHNPANEAKLALWTTNNPISTNQQWKLELVK
ncbi:hypothetical protein FRC03_004477 [Tulasnella sp. 419]|nr:hypothetical protein FRC03_004477 [Tulasnella sp. 419]